MFTKALQVCRRYVEQFHLYCFRLALILDVTLYIFLWPVKALQ